MNDIEQAANELAALLRSSREYSEFKSAQDAAFSNAATKALLDDYRKLQLKVQAAELAGGTDEEDMLRLQKLGELLQMNPVSSEYLFAQFRLNNLLGKVYKTLADAVDADLSSVCD